MTILFEQEWNDHPYAIVDTKTSNQSFVRYASLLKSMGVKNHLFPLQLHNRELQGINPYDPNLPLETMIMIGIECKNNLFYFLRECIRVPGSTIEDPIQFRANRGNMSLMWLFLNHITVILIQIRQTGKSFSTDVLMTWLLNLATDHLEINLLTKDDTLRSSNLERLKSIELELPFYLRQRTKGDIGNTEELTVKSLHNRYRGHLPNKSPKMALNVGRGLTSEVFQIDEGAFFYNIAITLPAALAAGTAKRDMARRKGSPYGTIITTTAGKKDDRDGAYVYNMVQNSAIWSESMFDAKDHADLENIVRKNTPKGELRVNCTFNHQQLGYTDEWLRRAIEESEAKGDAADRDFGNVWTSGSQQSPLSTQLLEAIRNGEVKDFYNEISPLGYITRWFIQGDNVRQRLSTGHYVMGIDSSDAGGGDDIGLILRDVRTGEVVAAGNYNETNLIVFSEWLVWWLETYPNITMIIERRSSGAMILDYLCLMLPPKGIDPFSRLYNKGIQEADEYPERFKEITKPLHQRRAEIYTKYKTLFGFATSGTGATSRNDLYGSTFQNAAKLTGSKIKDTKTINQLLSLVIRNGRIEHPADGNDDMVMALMFSYWLISLGKNLHCYGINVREILIHNKTSQEINNPVTLYNSAYQDALRSEIEGVVEELSKSDNDYHAMRLESKLKSLSQELTEEDKQILSVDELIQNLRESRQAARSRYYYAR